MNIQYLAQLRDNPIEYGSLNNFENEGIQISEIEQLEQTWNNGNPFPTALRELLFLAGKSCYVLDYGPFQGCRQQMQVEARQWMTEEDMERTITRPFYVLEVLDFCQFLMIYLDEGHNPFIYNASLSHEDESALGELGWLYRLDYTLKDFINSRISDVKKGYNPF